MSRGVQLTDGTVITANIVVSDINAKTLYLKMIGEEHMLPMAAKGMKSYNYSISVPMVYVGLDYEPPLDAHHSIIAQSPEDVNRQYFDYIKAGKLAQKTSALFAGPLIQIRTLAPKEKHILNIIPEGGYYLKDTTWDEEKPAFIERTIR